MDVVVDTMKTPVFAFFVLTVGVGGLVGCKKSESSLLDRDIPHCDRLMNMEDPEMKAYRIAAYKDCAKAKTMQEIMNSVGCQVKSQTGRCKSTGYQISALAKEREEALKE